MFRESTILQIEKYAKIWADSMPKSTGLCFQLQEHDGKYRTVVTYGHKEGTVINKAAIIDFSDYEIDPNKAWNPNLLDRYVHLLNPRLYFIASYEVMMQIKALVDEASDLKSLNAEVVYKLLFRGRLTLNEVYKKNVHLKYIFEVFKTARPIVMRNKNEYAIFLTERNLEDDED